VSPLLETRGLRLEHCGGLLAGPGLDWRVEAGSRWAIRGASGVGKSSLLAALLGFAQPAAGDILWQGRPLSPQNIGPWRRQVAWLPQHTPTSGTARDFFHLPFGFKANRQLAPTAGKLAGLFERLLLRPDCLERRMAELSGGERRKLSLAQAYLLARPVWLVDELSAGLDARGAEAAHELLFSLPGTTLLGVWHDDAWAARCAHQLTLDHAVPSP